MWRQKFVVFTASFRIIHTVHIFFVFIYLALLGIGPEPGGPA